MKKIYLGVLMNIVLNSLRHMKEKRGGEFYTPTSIVKTIVEILKPYRGRVYDPACGFRVIIMTRANSQVNTRGLELLPKFKIKKMNSGVLFRTVSTEINVVNSTSA